MKEYLEGDPFRTWFLPDANGKKKKKKVTLRGKRLREELLSTDGDDSLAADGSIGRTSKRFKSNNNNNNEDDDGSNESSNSSDEEENKDDSEKKDNNEKKRSALQYYRYDLNDGDVPDKYLIAKENNFEKSQLGQQFNELNDDNDGTIVNGKEVTEETTRKNEVGGPLGYGNCLVAITCTCCHCCGASSSPAAAVGAVGEGPDSISDDDNDAVAPTNPSSFLVHPVGEKLSSITIDKLILPRDDEGEDCTPPPPPQNSNTIDVGGTILQIAICGAGVTNKVKRMNQEEDCQSECLVVRTSRYCVVILAKACHSKGSSSEEEANDNSNNDGKSDDASLSSTKLLERCSTSFELMELSRIDLCKPTHPPSYLPVYVACDPKVVFSPFANPSFAILSRSNQEQTISGIDCTTIHEIVQFGDESSVTKHTLSSSLSNISLIEYHASEMSVLWAAARAKNVPKSYIKDKDDNHGGGALRGGYGHSLFKINLRNDSVTHIWSPSKAEYTPEGVHSINGIMNDLRYKHLLWVSSSSACKVWALDVRHNAANVVMCFSLAQLSDDFGPELGVAGFYGAGMIMTQSLPINEECAEDDCSDASEQRRLLQDTPPTMFGVKKDPNTYSLHTYQLPTTMPRFQTMPLEASSFVEAPSVKYSTSCIARSNIYPLPICSDKTFRVGLATLRCSSNSALRKAYWKDKLGYDGAPDIIYALTMTSVGDIHCHALLECDSKKEVQARYLEGMPVGAAAISVPASKRDDKAVDGGLHILLRNDFPPPFNDVALF